MATRRDFIKIIGGGTIIAAGAAIGLVAYPPGVPDAAAAWRNPGADETDIRRKALSYAILAPNPHNMQPWLVDLSQPDVVTLSLDTSRLLPATDPYGRQIILGCGAFLELMVLAANVFGANVDIALWPEGTPEPMLDSRPFARVTFNTAVPRNDPLFDHILNRRTNREIYDMSRVPSQDDLDQVIRASSISDGLHGGYENRPEAVAALRDIVWRGWELEMRTPAALAESVNVMRIGDRAIAAHRDGLTLGGPLMNLMGATGLVSREALLDPASSANAQGAAMWKEKADTSPAFVWISSDDNSRVTQIEAGRCYARMNLAATAQGLSMHPWSMALQEYPEMADLYAEQQRYFGKTKDAPVQMLARIGYAPPIPPAPRRGLDAQLKV
ncbi:MAG: twin-arginine translocation pathway signal protein [Parvibaculum sp.]|nr:twin-arginine translocation pathway signal protein [Parvibaculum sp.]